MVNNLLLSFPRSGNTWVRYIFECITKSPTSQGIVTDCQEGVFKEDCLSSKLSLGADVNKKCILIKRHRADFPWDNWTKDNCKLLFLLRDYKEAIIRHNYNQDDHTIESHVAGYIHCLEFYDKFDGEKKLINYEDLILDPRAEIYNMIRFLDIKFDDHYYEFFDNLVKHKNTSIMGYGASTTKGNPKKLKMHAQAADVALINEIGKLVKSNTNLYKKYLKRYG